MLDYFRLGHEQWTVKKSFPAKVFYFLFGHVNSTLRMDHYHIIRTVKTLSPHHDLRILDAGCGFGGCALYLARIFPSCQIVGIDINEKNIETCTFIANKFSLRNASFRLQDLDNFDSPEEYDIIYSSNVLEHIQDDEDLLQRFYSALKPGGHLVINIPNKEHRNILRKSTHVPQYVWDLATPHVRDGYSEDELRRKVAAAGLRKTKFQYIQGTWGILSHELTILFWDNQYLNSLATLLTFPVAFLFGYFDNIVRHKSGNCMLMVAWKASKP
jgi:2-polyprenyl-3-methyl-5-hydroxy-6-metoxy-1,4-benzoquinol methylase